MTQNPREIVDDLEAKILADPDATDVSDGSEDGSAPVAEDVSPLTPLIEPTD